MIRHDVRYLDGIAEPWLKEVIPLESRAPLIHCLNGIDKDEEELVFTVSLGWVVSIVLVILSGVVLLVFLVSCRFTIVGDGVMIAPVGELIRLVSPKLATPP